MELLIETALTYLFIRVPWMFVPAMTKRWLLAHQGIASLCIDLPVHIGLITIFGHSFEGLIQAEAAAFMFSCTLHPGLLGRVCREAYNDVMPEKPAKRPLPRKGISTEEILGRSIRR